MLSFHGFELLTGQTGVTTDCDDITDQLGTVEGAARAPREHGVGPAHRTSRHHVSFGMDGPMHVPRHRYGTAMAQARFLARPLTFPGWRRGRLVCKFLWQNYPQ